MTRLHDQLRAGLLFRAGVTAPPQLPPLDELRRTEWCEAFETLRRNRLVMGAFRYGLLAAHEVAGRSPHRDIDSAIDRLRKYQQTGNQEHLVDAANLCMKEFRVGDHPRRHWAAADDEHHTEPAEGREART